MWLMSLFSTWINISPIAVVKVQLYHPSPLCFLIQHCVPATPNKLHYKTRGCWPNETQAGSTFTDKTETAIARFTLRNTCALSLQRQRAIMTDGEEEESLADSIFNPPSAPPHLNFFGGRFIQDVTAACVSVGAFKRVTALWLCVCVRACVCVCQSNL